MVIRLKLAEVHAYALQNLLNTLCIGIKVNTNLLDLNSLNKGYFTWEAGPQSMPLIMKKTSYMIH